MQLWLVWITALVVFAPVVQASAVKEVLLKWSAIPGAVEYEIEVKDGTDYQVETKTKKTEWKGSLPYGLNGYRIRAIDALGRPGDWSAVRPIVVMPPAAELISPRDQSKLLTYGPHTKILLQWKKILGVSKYRVEIRNSKQKLLQEHLTDQTEIEIKGLAPGTYLWSVLFQIEANKNTPKELHGKKWMSTSNTTQVFSLSLGVLGAAQPISPTGRIPHAKKGKQSFNWTPVPGALKYSLLVFPKGSNKWVRMSTSETTSLELDLVHDGKYTWSIQALAHDGRTPSAAQSQPGPVSKLDFEIDRNALFLEGSGFLALSGMYAPFTYSLNSQARDATSKTSSRSIVSRLAGDYWWSADWGVGGSFDYTLMPLSGNFKDTSNTISPQVFSRYEAELVAKYRLPFSNSRYGWFLAPKLGANLRESPHILAIAPTDGRAPYFTVDSYVSLGASAGMDLKKQFTDQLSLSIRSGIFFPILNVKGPRGSSLRRGSPLENAYVGAQALYWLSSSWGFGAGLHYEKRLNRGAAGYVTNLDGAVVSEQSATEMDSLQLDATYFHGSLIYRFGD
jgi:hypothetical protein